MAVAIVCAAIVVVAALPASRRFVWSPYYKLAVEPIDVVYDYQSGAPIRGTHRFGYSVAVNHDFYPGDAGPAHARRERLHAGRTRHL